MPPGGEEDWGSVARSGNLEALQKLIKAGDCKPGDNKAQDAVVVACSANQTQALVILLDWGVPVAAKDLSGRRAFHAAAECGSANALAIMIDRGTDVDLPDDNRRTAFDLALARGHLGAAKELLRKGAKVPENASTPGLSQIIKEVNMEKHIERLMETARSIPEVAAESLAKADTAVWEGQREHMRLLRLKEEQRIGHMLARYHEREQSELAVAERSKQLEAEHLASIADQKAQLLAKKNYLQQLMRDLVELEGAERKLAEEDAKLKEAIQERVAELATTEAEIEARDAAAKSEQEAIDVALEKQTCLDAEIKEREDINAELRETLAAQQRDLMEWRQTREEAARLTAEAHKLLGT